jgi:hypothetical protein
MAEVLPVRLPPLELTRRKADVAQQVIVQRCEPRVDARLATAMEECGQSLREE